VAVGDTLVLGTVHYATSIDGVGNFSLANVSVGDQPGFVLISCHVLPSDPVNFPDTGNCFDASVQIGASNATATVTATPTDTATPTATATAGIAGTPTRLAFVTVTPIGSPSAVATSTPAAPPPPVPTIGGTAPGGTTPGGTTPGGGAGAGGAGPIRLPDTGAQGAAAGSDWMSIAVIALIALAAGSAAGGAYFGLAHVRGTRGGGR
jgi:hypothetical protein